MDAPLLKSSLPRLFCGHKYNIPTFSKHIKINNGGVCTSLQNEICGHIQARAGRGTRRHMMYARMSCLKPVAYICVREDYPSTQNRLFANEMLHTKVMIFCHTVAGQMFTHTWMCGLRLK